MPDPPTAAPPAGPRLLEAAGCESQEDFYRQTMMAGMHRYLERQRAFYLEPIDTSQYVISEFPDTGLFPLPATGSDQAGLRDGALLYRQRNGVVSVLDLGTAPPATLSVLDINTAGRDETIVAPSGSWLLLAASTSRELQPAPAEPPPQGVYDIAHPCSPGYSCELGPLPAIILSLVDVSDPLHPRRQRALTVPGMRVEALAGAGPSLRVAVHGGLDSDELWSRGLDLPPRGLFDPSDPAQRASLLESLAKARGELEARILATDVSGLVPWVEEDGVRRPTCGALYRPETVDSLRTLTVLSFPLAGEPPAATSLLSVDGGVYPAPGGFSVVRRSGEESPFRFAPGPPRSGTYSEVFAFADPGDRGGPRWSVQVPGFVMGSEALRERDGLTEVLSSLPYEQGSTLTTVSPSDPGQVERRRALPDLNPRAVQFEPDGGRLLVASTRSQGHADHRVLRLLDPSGLAGVDEVATDARLVRWLGLDHALSLEQDGGRLALRVRDLAAGLPVRHEIVVTDDPTRRWLEVSASVPGPISRFASVPGGVLLVLSLAVPASCAGVSPEREEVALYHASDDGSLSLRATVPLPGPCESPWPLGASSVRGVSLDGGELTVATDRALVRFPLDAGASPAVVELP